MKRFSKLLGIGIISGLILGGILGIVQQFTNKKVYLLLMNVDYIPIVKDWNVGPVMGFMFHLIVSVAIVFVLYYVLKKKTGSKNSNLYSCQYPWWCLIIFTNSIVRTHAGYH